MLFLISAKDGENIGMTPRQQDVHNMVENWHYCVCNWVKSVQYFTKEISIEALTCFPVFQK